MKTATNTETMNTTDITTMSDFALKQMMVRAAVKALTVGTEYNFAGADLRIVRIPAAVAKRGFGFITVKFLKGVRRGTTALYPAESAVL